ncbi:MAG: carbon-nitrogen hydrolase family protein [Candidatus Heimdallarchaeota archaeon]|nr:MAG: carbon-nitrogen hydrolase family protein [Candidatus Heimdallarchaeota archaeon]
MISSQLKITALQPNLTIDEFENNLDEYRNLFSEYSTTITTSKVICFPEYWNGMRRGTYTDIINESSLEFLKNTALRYKAWIIGGSHLIKQNDAYSNRAHIFNPSGHLIGTYNKRHPFGYEQIQEISPGNKNLFWQIDDWKATIQICSDLWNTNDYSLLVTKDIDLVFCPILTTIPDQSFTNYGRFMWYNLAVIRAKEAATAVIVSDSAMQPIRDPYWCAGASCIVDPSWRFTNEDTIGKNILSSIPDGSRGIITVTLDLKKIRQQRQYRRNMGLL